jgi:hypothetical protein
MLPLPRPPQSSAVSPVIMIMPASSTSHYAARMKPRRSRAVIVNALATIALVFSTLTGWAAQLQSHCASHSESAQVVAAHQQHQSEHPSPTWTNAHRHSCEHCPPSECSRVAPCTMSSSGALVASVASLAALTEHGVDPASRHDALPLSYRQPPIPPPQLLS